MKNFIYILFAISILSCTKKEKNLPDNFDFGTTEQGVYTNDYFDLEIQFDPSWSVQDKQQVNNLVESATDISMKDNQNLKSIVKASMVNSAYLLTIFKYEVGSPVEFNPSFMAIAENTKNFPGIKNGGDYLFHAKNLLDQTNLEYRYEKEVFEKEISNANFHILEAKIDVGDRTVTQEYYATVSNGFSLSFIVSYMNESERDELYQIIKNIKIQ